MIYVIGLLRHGFDTAGEILRYTIMDTITDSPMDITPLQLRHLIMNCSTQVANAEILNDRVVVKAWVDNITVRLSGSERGYETYDFNISTSLKADKCEFILLSSNDNKYKVASYQGALWDLSYLQIEALISSKKIANCHTENNGSKLKISHVDAYKVINNKEFEKSIAIKYEAFLTKAAILGYGNLSFDYRIENTAVIMTQYTGSSSNILMPSFITAIRTKAFKYTKIDTLNLNEGLQSIGTLAFSGRQQHDGLKIVTIPSTVELIAPKAFSNNTKIYNDDGALNPDRFKLRSSKTLVLAKFD